ncbi:MAG TPA: TRAP transporter small permease [Kofleriaceae bacterium]|nr:TRAP transporter small permease [Kofleriaceae bacterium]
MNESSDGDGSPEPGPDSASPDSGDSGVPTMTEVPPTRRHHTPVTAAGPGAPLDGALGAHPMTFPDDGPLSRAVRTIDHILGRIEQGFVFGLLALVITVATIAALHDKVATEHIGRWWHYIVRGGTFAIAMFAAVFATQQQRHLAMDLVSRRLTPRGRLVLGVALKLLTIAVALVLFRSGLHQRAVAGGSEHLDVLGIRIVDADIVATISIGAALIALHSLLHLVIDVDYLMRGKLPPERARSGH